MSRVRRKGDVLRWDLEDYEAALLRRLRDGLQQTLVHGAADDAVVRRLFPAAVADDDAADRELRDLLRDDLLERKLGALDALLGIVERAEPKGSRLRVDLVDDEPMLVLGALNDLRLAIGARIGIEELDRDAVESGSPDETSLAVMDHLAWIQEQILAIVDPASVTGPEDL